MLYKNDNTTDIVLTVNESIQKAEKIYKEKLSLQLYLIDFNSC